jgi:hypothetical protein
MAKHLMRVFAGVGSGAVDIFNIVTRAWSTAQLRIPRFHLAAASVGNLTIFAGGQDKNLGIVLLKNRERTSRACLLVSNSYLQTNILARSRFLTRSFAGVAVGAVDIFNIVTRAWSTAQLSIPRFSLAAASVGNLAIFAGGSGTIGGLLMCSERASLY